MGFQAGLESGAGYNAVHCGLSPVPQHCVHRRDTDKTISPIKPTRTPIPTHLERIQEELCYGYSATTFYTSMLQEI